MIPARTSRAYPQKLTAEAWHLDKPALSGTISYEKISPSRAPTSLRVRIHLNLKEPARAENTVLVQSSTGAWVAVAYAHELALTNAAPVVFKDIQQKIAAGKGHKTPHAFIEGDLIHFRGRLRTLAPTPLKDKAAPFLKPNPLFPRRLQQAFNQNLRLGYNPRFSSHFYRDAANKKNIREKWIRADKVIICGWAFYAVGPVFAPLAAHDICAPAAIDKTTAFEKAALRKGRQTTKKMTAHLHKKTGP